ncbi:MAG: hypothetical protein VB032_01865, partial [Burkholderiaceae bacterium]|nr:hypothetical protein [Burkholderiaceae bacterium]
VGKRLGKNGEKGQIWLRHQFLPGRRHPGNDCRNVTAPTQQTIVLPWTAAELTKSNYPIGNNLPPMRAACALPLCQAVFPSRWHTVKPVWTEKYTGASIFKLPQNTWR